MSEMPSNIFAPLEWTDEQFRVIGAAPNERLLVNAGPGTGKTATACARIAWLIDNANIEPHEIWLISFTKTAVRELRDRIRAYLVKPEMVAGLRIATIDSQAWAIHSGFNPKATLTSGYEQNIRDVSKLMQSHEGLLDYISGVKYLLIDEAQDINGARIEYILELINALPEDSGVTVLFDEAQCIYGFTENSMGNDIKGSLPMSLREYMDNFREVNLTKIQRTKDITLKNLYMDGRNILLEKTEKYKNLYAFITENNHGEATPIAKLESTSELSPNSLILFRNRGDALTASSYLRHQEHRIRMSGFPPAIHWWLGKILYSYTDQEIDETEFTQRWKELFPGGLSDIEVGNAWSSLVRVAGISSNLVSLHSLAKRLSVARPPDEFCLPDFGTNGPIIGTIHGNKGREAEEVLLYISKPWDEADLDEEARVLFVGASRAKQKLFVGTQSYFSKSSKLEPSGRAYTKRSKNPKSPNLARASVEVGRLGDITASTLVGKNHFSTSEMVGNALSEILNVIEKKEYVCAKLIPGAWKYGIYTEDSENPLFYLDKSVNDDLFDIAKILKKKKRPMVIPYIRIMGMRTLALHPESPEKHNLHSPWCHSGFILAPMIIGYSIAHFS